MKSLFPHEKLKSWFLSVSRDLPWRHNPSPYAVWVSEVMLQQTQVSVVIPYFLRWMDRFPTVQSLAEAPLEEAVKLWEGLGYYSRVRNLHAGAQQIVRDFHGVIPKDNLLKIKGIGPYTAGAILSFAFHQKAAAVDGNVIRVLARYSLIEDDISKPRTIKKIWDHAQTLLPEKEPWIFNEALIELGATICTRTPKCGVCPLKQSCQGHLRGQAESLPFKSAKKQVEVLHRTVAVIECRNHLLVKQCQLGKVMGGLYEFPYFENKSMDQIQNTLSIEWKLKLDMPKELPKESHSFTRYRVFLNPTHFVAETPTSVPDYQWVSLTGIEKLAFSSGHRRILEKLRKEK